MINEESLPAEWVIHSVDEITESIRTGGTPKKSIDDFWGGSTPWRTSTHFQDNSLELEPADEFITEQVKGETKRAQAGDVLLVTRVNTGKVALPDHVTGVNQDIKVLKVDDSIVRPEYFARYLQSLSGYFSHLERGGTISGITTDDVKEIPVPVPPLDKQERIVSLLDNAFKSIDTLSDTSKQGIQKAETFIDAISRDKLEPEPLPPEWEIATVGEICENAINGGTPKRSVDDYWNGDIPWLSSGEVRGKEVSSAEESITRTALQESSAKIFPQDSVLVAMYGSGTRGRPAILRESMSGNQAICCLVPDKSVIAPEYLWHYLRTIKDELADKGRGGAQKNLNQSMVLDVTIPLPPLEVQEDIVTELDSALNHGSQCMAKFALASSYAESLRESLLQTACSGKLLRN